MKYRYLPTRLGLPEKEILIMKLNTNKYLSNLKFHRRIRKYACSMKHSMVLRRKHQQRSAGDYVAHKGVFEDFPPGIKLIQDHGAAGNFIRQLLFKLQMQMTLRCK